MLCNVNKGTLDVNLGFDSEELWLSEMFDLIKTKVFFPSVAASKHATRQHIEAKTLMEKQNMQQAASA